MSQPVRLVPPVPAPFDGEWQVEGNTCQDFFRQSRNGKNSNNPGAQGFLPRVSVPKWMESMAYDLVSDLPAYRNVHDVVRNGVFRVLWWHQEDPLLDLRCYRDQAIAEQREADLDIYFETVEHHTRRAEELLPKMAGVPEERQKLIDDLLLMADKWWDEHQAELRKIIKKACNGKKGKPA